MERQDRIVAGITLAHALAAIPWTFWVAWKLGTTDTLVYDMVLASGGIAAGVGWFRGRYWAGFVAFAYYLVQLVRVATPGFEWSFMLGFNLSVGLGWAPERQLALNLFALAMLVWAAVRAFGTTPRNEKFDRVFDATGGRARTLRWQRPPPRKRS